MLTFVKYLLESENEPRWERDTNREVYIVYNSDGSVHSEHKYDQVWNSSPAYNAAVKDVNKLKMEQYQREKHHREYELPLTNYEHKYADGKRRMTDLFKLLKALPPESTEYKQYEAEYYKIADDLKRLSDDGLVRGSVIMGKHKDLA